MEKSKNPLSRHVRGGGIAKNSALHILRRGAIAVIILLLLFLPNFAMDFEQPRILSGIPAQRPASAQSLGLTQSAEGPNLFQLTDTNYDNSFLASKNPDGPRGNGPSVAWYSGPPQTNSPFNASHWEIGYSYLNSSTGQPQAGLAFDYDKCTDCSQLSNLAYPSYDNGTILIPTSLFLESRNSPYLYVTIPSNQTGKITVLNNTQLASAATSSWGNYFAALYYDVRFSNPANPTGYQNFASEEIFSDSGAGPVQITPTDYQTENVQCVDPTFPTSMEVLYDPTLYSDIIAGANGRVAYAVDNHAIASYSNSPCGISTYSTGIDLTVNVASRPTKIAHFNPEVGNTSANIPSCVTAGPCFGGIAGFWNNLLVYYTCTGGLCYGASAGIVSYWVYDLTTGKTTLLLVNPISPSFLSDGISLAYTTYTNSSSGAALQNLYVYSPLVPTSNKTILVKPGSEFSYLIERGSYLTWQDGANLWVYNIPANLAKSVNGWGVGVNQVFDFNNNLLAWASPTGIFYLNLNNTQFLNNHTALTASAFVPSSAENLGFRNVADLIVSGGWIFFTAYSNYTGPPIALSPAGVAAAANSKGTPLQQGGGGGGQDKLQVLAAKPGTSPCFPDSTFTTSSDLSVAGLAPKSYGPPLDANFSFTAGVYDKVGLVISNVKSGPGQFPFLNNVSIPVFNIYYTIPGHIAVGYPNNRTFSFSASDPHSTSIQILPSKDYSLVYFKFTFEKDYTDGGIKGTLCVTELTAFSTKSTTCEVFRLDCYRLVPAANFSWYDSTGKVPTLSEFVASERVALGKAAAGVYAEPGNKVTATWQLLSNLAGGEYVAIVPIAPKDFLWTPVVNGKVNEQPATGTAIGGNLHTAYSGGALPNQGFTANPLSVIRAPGCRPDGFDCFHEHFYWSGAVLGTNVFGLVPSLAGYSGGPGYIDPLVDPLTNAPVDPGLAGEPYLFSGQTINVATLLDTPANEMANPVTPTSLQTLVDKGEVLASTAGIVTSSFPASGRQFAVNDPYVAFAANSTVQWILASVAISNASTFFKMGFYATGPQSTAKSFFAPFVKFEYHTIKGDPTVNLTQLSLILNQTLEDRYWTSDGNSLDPANSAVFFSNMTAAATMLQELTSERPDIRNVTDDGLVAMASTLNLLAINALGEADLRFGALYSLEQQNNRTADSAFPGLSAALLNASIALNQANTAYNVTLSSGSLTNATRLVGDFSQIWNSAEAGNLTQYGFTLSPTSNSTAGSTVSSKSNSNGGNISTSNTVSHQSSTPTSNSGGSFPQSSSETILLEVASVVIVGGIVGLMFVIRRKRRAPV